MRRERLETVVEFNTAFLCGHIHAAIDFNPSSLSSFEIACGGEEAMANIAAIAGASVSIGAPRASVSPAASSAICSSSSSSCPVFVRRRRSFHGGAVQFGARRSGFLSCFL